MISPAISIDTLGQDTRAWDAYVADAPSATFFHQSGWKTVIERAFGHRCYFLQAVQGGVVRGILPLVHIRSRLFTNALISTPFCVYGGAVADTDAVAEILYSQASRLAETLGVSYLESRERSVRHADWPRKDLYYTFRRPLAGREEERLAAIPRKQRAVVRKAIDSDLTWQIDKDLSRFYPLYAHNLRSLGTPLFSKRYLRELMRVFGNDCDVLTVSANGNAVASVLSFYFRDEVLPYYSGAGEHAREHKANDFLYWALMCHASERGASVFDFGRSKADTGPYHFKRHWGFEPEPLAYEYYLVGADRLPDLSPANPKYARFIKAWQSLPLPITKIIGPFLSKDLG